MSITAQDLMVTDLYTVPSAMPLVDFDQALYQRKISGAPVVDHGELVGIVSRTDVSHHISGNIEEQQPVTSYFFEADGTSSSMVIGGENPEVIIDKMRRYCVADVMTNEVISVSPQSSAQSVAALMVDKRIHRVLVVDDKKLIGLITTLDIVKMVAMRD